MECSLNCHKYTGSWVIFSFDRATIVEGPGLPRGIVWRLEEGIWQEWDGVCTIEHTIYRQKPLGTQKERRSGKWEPLHSVFLLLWNFCGHLGKQCSRNGHGVKTVYCSYPRKSLSTIPHSHEHNVRKDRFNDLNCSEVQFSRACCWDLRGGVPILEVWRRKKGNKGKDSDIVDVAGRRERSEWANEGWKTHTGGWGCQVHVGECFLAGKMISLSTQAAPQGVVHSFTAHASDSNTLPPPTSPFLPSPHLPPAPLSLLHASCTVCCRVLGERRKPKSLITRKRSHLALTNSIPHKFAFPPHNIT